MQDFFHRRCLPRFGFPLTSRHASVDAASAGAATQSTPSGGALTNSRLPSSSTSRYPAVHASVERSLRCEKPLAAIRLPAMQPARWRTSSQSECSPARSHRSAPAQTRLPSTQAGSPDLPHFQSQAAPERFAPLFSLPYAPSFLLQRMSIPRLLCPACTACGFVYHNHNPQVMRRNFIHTVHNVFHSCFSV